MDTLLSALGALEQEALFGGEGGGAKPTGESYEIVMDALIRAGRCEEAASLFPRLAAAGPTAKGVALAMTALVRVGRAGEALALLPGAVAAGADPSDGVARVAVKAVMALGGGEEGLGAVRGALTL